MKSGKKGGEKSEERLVILPSEKSPAEYALYRNFKPLSEKELKKGRNKVKYYKGGEHLPWDEIYAKIRLDVPYEDIEQEYGQIRKIVLWAAHDNVTVDEKAVELRDEEYEHRVKVAEVAGKDPVLARTMKEVVNTYAPNVAKKVLEANVAIINACIVKANDVDEVTPSDLNNLAKAVQISSDTMEITQRHSTNIGNVNVTQAPTGFTFELDAPPAPEDTNIIEGETDE